VRLANRKSADGIAGAVLGGYKLGTLGTQVGIGAALHNGEQGLVVAIQGLGTVKPLYTTGKPAVGHLHAFAGILILAGVRGALVKGHDDIGPNAALDVHHPLGGKQVLAAINMRGEFGTFLGKLALGR
jgi:hypothetical protein